MSVELYSHHPVYHTLSILLLFRRRRAKREIHVSHKENNICIEGNEEAGHVCVFVCVCAVSAIFPLDSHPAQPDAVRTTDAFLPR